MLGIMVALNWQVGLIALGTLPLLCFSQFHLYRKTRVSARKQRRQEGQVASRMTEVLTSIRWSGRSPANATSRTSSTTPPMKRAGEHPWRG
jgi:ABC-type multidrug transport system fused ATPase/permease subunit